MTAYATTVAPHLRARDSVPRRFWITALALSPALASAFFWFRWGAVSIVLISVFTAIGTEFASAQLFRKKTAFYNGSTILAALLFSVLMPPAVPFGLVVLGSFFTVLFGKEIFGGLGANLFHPALLGVSFLWVSFPEQMNPYQEPFSGILTNHPLSLAGQGLPASPLDLFFGKYAGTIGGTNGAALLAGGLVLIWKRLIDWRIPVIFLGTLFLFSEIFGLDPWIHLLCGSAFLAAFFLITDPVTTPVTPKGNWFFALGAAFCTVLLRRGSSSYDGIVFAVLLMNAFTPWIDEWVRPRRVNRSYK